MDCSPSQPPAPTPTGGPSDQLDIFTVSLSAGPAESPLDTYHALDMHVGDPVQMSCRLDCREQRAMQVQGEFNVLPAGIVGRWMVERPAEALILRLSPLLLHETAEAIGVKRVHAELAPAVRARDPHIEHISWMLRAEREAGYPNGRLYLDSLASTVAARLLRRYGGAAKLVGLSSKSAANRELPKWRLRSVYEYIDANLDRNLSLQELATIAGFSISHFKPLFRQAAGLPVHRYVVERRVERARQLLLRGEHTMSDIALEAGFTHQSHMVRCLRRVLGITPAQVAALLRHRA